MIALREKTPEIFVLLLLQLLVEVHLPLDRGHKLLPHLQTGLGRQLLGDDAFDDHALGAEAVRGGEDHAEDVGLEGSRWSTN